MRYNQYKSSLYRYVHWIKQKQAKETFDMVRENFYLNLKTMSIYTKKKKMIIIRFSVRRAWEIRYDYNGTFYVFISIFSNYYYYYSVCFLKKKKLLGCFRLQKSAWVQN